MNPLLSLVFLLLFLFSSFKAFAADCYIDSLGSGTKTGYNAQNALPWENGDGLRACMEEVLPGDTVYLAQGNYTLTKPIDWIKSGEKDFPITIKGSGLPASNGDFGKSVLKVKDAWPTIFGTRQYPTTLLNASSGENFMNFAKGVQYITIQRLNLQLFEYVFDFSRGQNNSITISDIYAENIRIFLYSIADPSCSAKTFFKIDYVNGNGNIPEVNSTLNGLNSHAKSKIRSVAGDGSSGTIYLSELERLFEKDELLNNENNFEAQAKGGVRRVYECADQRGSKDWQISRVYMLGVTKRVIGAEGLRDAVLSDMYADLADPAGNLFLRDFSILWHFSGASQHITLNRIIGNNPGYDDAIYDNGDCFASENLTSHITFNQAYCFDSMDGGYDLKGGPHFINDAICFRNKRNFRFWHGPVTVTNSISGYAKKGELSQKSQGSGESVWLSGVAYLNNFTSINNPSPEMLDTNGHLKSLTYDSGQGKPVSGTEIVGKTSGASAKIAGITSDSDEIAGKLLIYNTVGAFMADERVFSPESEFSAKATSTGKSTQTPFLGTVNNIIALDKNFSKSKSKVAGKGSGFSVGDVVWIEDNFGENPQFKDMSLINWQGGDDNFNSELYQNKKGFYLNCQNKPNKPTIKIRTHNFGTIPINTQSPVQEVIVANEGDTDITIKYLRFSGEGARAFQVLPMRLPFSIHPHESKNIPITFFPQEVNSYRVYLKIGLGDNTNTAVYLLGIGKK